MVVAMKQYLADPNLGIQLAREAWAEGYRLRHEL